MKCIISLLPTMKSTTCVSCQAGRQMRCEEEEEEEEEEKALGSSTKIKVKKKTHKKITIYTHIKKKVSVAAICQN